MGENSISSFLTSYGMTGNPMIDSLIIANIIPLFISYSNNMVSLISSLLNTIFTFVLGFIKYRLKAKVTGNVVCKAEFKEGSEMYNFLKEQVIDADIEADTENSKFAHFFEMTNEITTNMEKENVKKELGTYYYNYYYGDTDKFIDMEVDYHDADKLFKYNKSYGFDDSKKKLFNYGNYVIKVIHRISESYKEITIELVSFSKSNEDRAHYVKIFKDFMRDRLEIDTKFEYLYRFIIDKQETKEIFRSLLQNGYLDSGTGRLRYGDKTMDDKHFKETKNSKYIGKNFSVVVNCTNLSDASRDFKDQIKFYETTKDINSVNKGFFSIYKKFYTNDRVDSYGYFMKGNKTYLIWNYDGNYYLMIISLGNMLTEFDLKDEVNWLIQKGIESRDFYADDDDEKHEVNLCKRLDGRWKNYVLEKRSFDTIYLPFKLMSDIKNEIEKFLEMEKLYREYQIPYKKGILLHGPPGTGKTSLVKSLAFEYQLNIYTINVNDDEINDDSIIDVLNSIGGGKKILLFEDIDTAFADKEKIKVEDKSTTETKMATTTPNATATEKTKDDEKKDDSTTVTQTQVQNKKFLTYSGLLNALDGVMSNQHGVITIMTTNNKWKLGDAFLRPGRIDKMFELSYCNNEQISVMTKTFIMKRLNLFDKEEEMEKYNDQYLDDMIKTFTNKLIDRHNVSFLKPCELQYYLLRYIEDIDGIFLNVQELIEQYQK